MGCGKSKIKKIHLAQDQSDGISRLNSDDINTISNGKLGSGSVGLDSSLEGTLPNRLLAAMPVSDLGESLDSRHLGESLNLSHHSSALANGVSSGVARGGTVGGGGNARSALGGGGVKSADSTDSADSGYDEYEEEYSHIITEKSDPDSVRRVEDEFRPVELPELLVITGRACTRIVSGYQKTKQDEAQILSALREEGLLAKPKGKTSGGLSFEVVDASVVERREAAMAAAGGGSLGSSLGGTASASNDAFVSARFMPRTKLERLEQRRVNIRKPSAHLSERLADAEERRRAAEEEKVKKVLEHSGVEQRNGRIKSARSVRSARYSASVARRQAQLSEMRDKLKERNRQADMVRLKKDLHNDSLNLESGFSRGNDNFFDD